MNDFYGFIGFLGLFFGMIIILGSISFFTSDETKSGFMVLVFGIALCLIGYFGARNNINFSEIYNNICLEYGFVEAYQKGDSWYCLSFGEEPRIMLAGREEQ